MICWRYFVGFILLLAGSASPAGLTSPLEMFGFHPGANSQLVDRSQLLNYFELLARESNCLKIDTLGQTTAGLPLTRVTISAPENLANLEAFRKIQATLADPRGFSPEQVQRTIQQGKVIVSVNCSIHSNEIGPTQMAPNLVYRLLSETTPVVQKILDRTIILLLPVHNPDGLQPVVDWFRKYAGTQYEGGPLPWLYHRYAGHDLNRDWYSFTQPEVRLTVEKIYRQWFPQIVLDLHQMGYYSARQFIPPYIEPIDPALHPLQRTQLEILGDSMLHRLTTDGFQGVVNRAFYDTWTPARGFAFYYGGLRLLSETASCKIAAPIYVDQIKAAPPGLGFDPDVASANHPAPWSGGKWNFSDVVSLQEAVVMNTLQFAAEHWQSLLENFSQITREAVKPGQIPAGYAIRSGAGPEDAVEAFLANLEFAGVEFHQTTKPVFQENMALDSGTVIIQTAQPMKIFIQSLLENVSYPQIPQPNSGKLQPNYDITTHYLPLFYGVDCRPLATLPPVGLKKIKVSDLAKKQSRPKPGWGYLADFGRLSVIHFLNQLLAAGVEVTQLYENVILGEHLFPQGTLQIPAVHQELIETLAQQHGIALYGIETPVAKMVKKLRQPRIGLYQSWLAPTDAGWTRFLCDSYGFNCRTLHNQEIQKMQIENELDVIIFPNQTAEQIYHGFQTERLPAEFTGGIGKTGVNNLKLFVSSGGTIIFINHAGDLALKFFAVAAQNSLRNLPAREFNLPGAFVSLQLKPAHPLAFGYCGEVPILFNQGPAFETPTENSVGFFARDLRCLSGLCIGAEKLSGLTGLAEFPRGAGKLILFGFQPQFRAQTAVTFKLLFNAIYYSVAKPN